MDRRGIFGDRRAIDRRDAPAFRPAQQERRSGADRRADERRTERGDRRQRDAERHQRPQHQPAASGLPLDRLIPAAVVVLASLVDLFVAQATDNRNWGLLVVAAAIPIAAFALAAPRRWRWRLALVWCAVGVYLTAAAAHIAYLVAR